MTQEASAILGIDVAKAKVDVVLKSHDGESYETFPNDPSGFKKLSQWLKKRKVKTGKVGLEATSIYHEALALYLHERGWVVYVLNPSRLHAYAKSQLSRNKTDKGDAFLIAQFVATQELDVWTPPSPAWRELQALVRHIQDLKDEKQVAQVRLQTARTALVQASLEKLIAFLEEQIDELVHQIKNHLDQHPDLKSQHDLLTSIPGIGDWSAAQILSELPTVEQFDNAKEVVAYAGLNPAHHQSGSSVKGYTAISKIGNARLRRALYMPALVGNRHNPILKSFYHHLLAQGKLKAVALTASMRKLLHLIFGILKSQKPFDPHFLNQKALLLRRYLSITER